MSYNAQVSVKAVSEVVGPPGRGGDTGCTSSQAGQGTLREQPVDSGVQEGQDLSAPPPNTRATSTPGPTEILAAPDLP
jgi:hypothetical protein